MSAGAVLDGRFRAPGRGIGGGTAGRTQTAIAVPGLRRVPTSGCVTARAAGGASGGRRNELAILSGSGGPRFLILQQCGLQIARNPGKARSTSAWNRKATGSYDRVAPTLVCMAFA